MLRYVPHAYDGYPLGGRTDMLCSGADHGVVGDPTEDNTYLCSSCGRWVEVEDDVAIEREACAAIADAANATDVAEAIRARGA